MRPLQCLFCIKISIFVLVFIFLCQAQGRAQAQEKADFSHAVVLVRPGHLPNAE